MSRAQSELVTPPELADFILQNKSEIVAEWEREVRAMPIARTLSRPALIDHIPQLLDRLAQIATDLNAGSPAALPRADAEAHALTRLDEGFDLTEVLAEYGVLREVVQRQWAEKVAHVSGIVAINKAIDRAISASVERYTQARDRTLAALDRIASVALESRSVEELLQRLLSAMVETAPAVDTAVILLREGEVLRVRAAVGLEEELQREYSLRIGEGFAGAIAADRQPREIRTASVDPLVKSPVIHGRGVRALYGVPLIDRGELIGVAHIGSLTAYSFSEQDKRVFAAMASRATVAISQQLLRDETERAHAQISREQQRLRTAIDAMVEGVLIVDADARVTIANDAAAQIFGVPREQLLRPIADFNGLFSPRDVEGTPRAPIALEALRGRVVLPVDREVWGKDGVHRFVRASASPLRDDQGRVTGAVVVIADVSAQRQADRERAELLAREQQARATTERALAELDALFSASSVGMALVDRELRIVRVNEALASLSGVPAREHLGKALSEVLPERARTLAPLFRRVIESGEPVQNVEFAEASDRRAFLANFFPVRSGAGQTIGAGAVVLDITERRRTIEALRVSEARLRIAADAAQMGTWDWDLVQGRLEWSDENRRIFGLPNGVEPTFATYIGAVHPDERAAVEGAISRALDPSGDGRYRAEYRIRREEDGAERWVACHARTLFDGKRATRMVGTTQDVTDRRKAEDAQRFLSDATARLASSLDVEKALEDVADLAVPRFANACTIDLVEAGGVRQVAAAADDPRKVLLGRELRKRMSAQRDSEWGLSGVLRSGRTQFMPDITDDFIEREWRDPEARRLLRELDVRSYLIVPMIARGKVLGAITLAASRARARFSHADLEIAEHLARRAALAVENARFYREAQDATRMREELLAVVSHDLRNPLGTINMAAALLLPKVTADARARKHIETVQRATGRMEHLVHDLLDIASIQAGRLSVEPTRLDARALVHEAVEFNGALAHEKGIKLVALDADGEAPLWVNADRDRLMQLFGNLIGNAIKFCRAGETVTVSARARDDDVLFAVADTGPGIAPDELPHIFDPYWSAARHARKGTGLGLYISKGIVEAHRGRIWADSTVGVGTTFWFTVPRAGDNV